MGISADLILFGSDSNNVLDDLNKISLYEFLPELIHPYIHKNQISIYDLDYYRELHQIPDLMVCGV